MDLGSSVCTAREPKCLLCPLAKACKARATGDPARLPVKAPKKPKPLRRGRAFWAEREGKVWLVRREGKGMLGGMRALPDDGWSARADGTGEAPMPGTWESAGVVRHVFTHAALELSVVVQRNAPAPDAEGEWWPIDRIDDAGLPTLFAKAARLVLAG